MGGRHRATTPPSTTCTRARTTLNVDDATFYAIEQNLGGVLSESWGGCEAGSSARDGDVLEITAPRAALQGISYLAASGDEGAADCEQGKGGL